MAVRGKNLLGHWLASSFWMLPPIALFGTVKCLFRGGTVDGKGFNPLE